MNVIDIVLASILLIGLIRGFLHGFIYEIAALGIIFVCYFFGFRIAGFIIGYIARLFNTNSTTLHYISLFIAWIGISIGIMAIAKLLEGLVSIAALGIFNKIAGALFGSLKYAVILSFALYFINKINVNVEWMNADARASSLFYYPILRISSWLL